MSLTPLSWSTVAIGVRLSADVQIWDWRQGKQLQTLAGFRVGVVCTALLPDGRLVATDWDGLIAVGKVNDWLASKFSADSESLRLSGLAVTRDGSFVTASQKDGQIKVWRNGVCTATFQGGFVVQHQRFMGNSLAVVGGRLLAVGKDDTALIFE